MKFLKDISFKEKRVIIRVDFNVPLNDLLEITDETRIIAALPSINYILDNGGTAVIISHLGRPRGVNLKLSLKPVSKRLSALLNRRVNFLDDCVGGRVEHTIKNSNSGDVFLLENLRFYNEETDSDMLFSEKLSRLGDAYINDAFGTSHRAHASTHGVVSFFEKEKYCGLLLEKEVVNLNKALNQNTTPSLAIIGGAKISSKIEVLYSLMNSVDKIIIGGGMAYTFIYALGGKIGSSLFEDDKVSAAKKDFNRCKRKGG